MYIYTYTHTQIYIITLKIEFDVFNNLIMNKMRNYRNILGMDKGNGVIILNEVDCISKI